MNSSSSVGGARCKTASLLLLSVKAQDRCTPPSGKPNCVCETNDGVIDLTSMSYQDGNP